jgi:hypothetical protein
MADHNNESPLINIDLGRQTLFNRSEVDNAVRYSGLRPFQRPERIRW